MLGLQAGEEDGQTAVQVQIHQKHLALGLPVQLGGQIAGHGSGSGAAFRAHHADQGGSWSGSLPGGADGLRVFHHGEAEGPAEQMAVATAFDEIVLGALLDQLEGLGFVVRGAENHHRDARGPVAQREERLRSTAVGEPQIQKHHVHAPAGEALQPAGQRIGPVEDESWIPTRRG